MTRLCESIGFHAWRLLRNIVPLLLLCVPAVTQIKAPAPMTAGEVMGHVAEMNEVRAKALESYSSLRSYHLECHGLVSKKADMLVRVDYHSPDKKEFTIVSESGSESVRRKVFRRLMEAELESMQDANQERSALTPENYTFRLVDYQTTDKDEFYVLEATPRNKSKFVFRGRIWVGTKDFAVTRVEGEPAVNPSWWTEKTDFTRGYQRIDGFWLPQSNESVTKVRMLGTAILTIEYQSYQVRQATVASVLTGDTALKGR